MMFGFTLHVRSIATCPVVDRSASFTCTPRLTSRSLPRFRLLCATPSDDIPPQSVPRDALLHEFQKLLEHRSPSTEWVKDVHGRGTALLTYLTQLEENLSLKEHELAEVQTRLNETNAALDQAKERETAAEAQLEAKSHDLVQLQKELNQLNHDHNADVTASMKRYQVLEEYSKQQEALVKIHVEEKQGLRAALDEISHQLYAQIRWSEERSQMCEAVENENAQLKMRLNDMQ